MGWLKKMSELIEIVKKVFNNQDQQRDDRQSKKLMKILILNMNRMGKGNWKKHWWYHGERGRRKK